MKLYNVRLVAATVFLFVTVANPDGIEWASGFLAFGTRCDVSATTEMVFLGKYDKDVSLYRVVKEPVEAKKYTWWTYCPTDALILMDPAIWRAVRAVASEHKEIEENGRAKVLDLLRKATPKEEEK